VFHADVAVTEITGSETYVHLQHADDEPWVALAHGVHNLASGKPVEVYVDVGNIYIFDAEEKLVAAAAASKAA
jgi:glycerol transport system ATP-binding protein